MKGNPMRRSLAGGLIVMFVVACGGGGAPAASPGGGGGAKSPAASTAGGGGGGGGGAGGLDIGEDVDKALVQGATDVLAATDSYQYDMSIIQQRSSDVRTQNVHGVVRTKPAKARSVVYEAGGDTIRYLFVDGKDFTDYGNGLQSVPPDQGVRDENDPLAIHVMYGSFLGHADDFIVKAKETVHDVATVHLVLNDETLADVREDYGTGFEAFIAELWLAEADGRLVKGIWGGPLVLKPPSQLQPLWSVDITKVDCTCPVTVPG
jgi:hypothetical protein